MDAHGFTERGRFRPCLSCTSLMKSFRSKLLLLLLVFGALAALLVVIICAAGVEEEVEAPDLLSAAQRNHESEEQLLHIESSRGRPPLPNPRVKSWVWWLISLKVRQNPVLMLFGLIISLPKWGRERCTQNQQLVDNNVAEKGFQDDSIGDGSNNKFTCSSYLGYGLGNGRSTQHKKRFLIFSEGCGSWCVWECHASEPGRKIFWSGGSSYVLIPMWKEVESEKMGQNFSKRLSNHHDDSKIGEAKVPEHCRELLR